MLVKEYCKKSNTFFGIECQKLLYSTKSKFQKIKVYSSKIFGNILMLDDCFMITEKCSDHYHDECLRLIDLKNNKMKVLIIGGGDFGLVKKISKEKSFSKIDVVEIDDKIINTCKKYFKNNFKFNSSIKNKVSIYIDDGYEWVKKKNNLKYDVIIIDCTDPNPIAKKLYSNIFYKNINYILKKDGVFIQQSGSPIIDYKKIIKPTIKKLKNNNFKKIIISTFHMPIYPLGLWSFIKSQKP